MPIPSIAPMSNTPYSMVVPSWVIPGTYLENLRFLADKPVAGVELLFFLYDQEIEKLLDAERAGIAEWRRRFTFTAHLPEKLQPEHEALVARLAPLVRHFIVHPALPDEQDAQARFLESWAEKYALPAPAPSGPPYRFLLENTLQGLMEAMLPKVSEKIGVCLDTGHLLEQGQNPAAFMRHYGSRIGEIHLHGMDRAKAALDGRLPDHRPIRARDEWFQEFGPLLADFSGVVNLEVFSWEEAAISLREMAALVPAPATDNKIPATATKKEDHCQC